MEEASRAVGHSESEVRQRYTFQATEGDSTTVKADKRINEERLGTDATPSRSQAPSEDEDDDPDKVESRYHLRDETCTLQCFL